MAGTFGEMLMNRRRQMGLSIQQVANTIKIRPQIIEFFETGNFAAMPPRGYAQGMISSYARYLGLNPRQVVEAYFDELRAYEAATAHEGGRFQDPAGYVSSRSSDDQGRYLMVDTPRSRYGQRPPQAGYVTDASYEATRSYGSHAQGRSYRSPSNRGYQSAEVTRRMPRVQGDDFQQGHTQGQRRPSGQRRPQGQNRSGQRRSPQRNQRGGRGRSGQGYPRTRNSRQNSFSEWLPIVFLIAAIAVVILLIVLLFRGCTAGTQTQDEGSAQHLVVNSSNDSNDDEQDNSSDEDTENTSTSTSSETNEDDTTSTNENDAAAKDKDAESQKTVVKISVADGESSWLEVRLDGSVVFGNEVPGPWEQEYTVEDSIRITANTPSAVTVTNNGDTVRWDTSTSGVARISITAPQKTTTTTDGTTDDATGETTDGDTTTDSTSTTTTTN